ncbi:MAG: heavy-metal-associated domain-containing protein [Ruminococcaceae bacterium]|nr:heavy-metal-associated domain-containing protein [Oscillospiraceae bacterium]
MKKSFKLENLGCAHCALKMEEAIKKIKGVDNASVNFIMQKLTIESSEEISESLLSEAQKAISRIERHCVIVK